MEAPRSQSMDSNCVEGGLQDTVSGGSSSVDSSEPGGMVSSQGPVEESCLGRRSLHDDAEGSFGDGQGISINRQAEQPGPSSPSLPTRPSQKSEGLAEVGRTSGVLREVSSTRKAEPQEHTMESKREVESEKFPRQDCSSSSGNHTSSRVVAEPGTHSKRDAIVLRPSRTSSFHGCIKGGMGCSSSREDSEGQMDRRRKVSTHQYPGDESGPGSLPTLHSGSERKLSGSDVRQRNSSGVHKKGRRIEVEGVVRSRPTSPEVGRRRGSQSVGEIHSGEEECSSRRLQQRGPGSGDRMVPSSRGSKLHHSDVGIPGNGSLRDKVECTTPHILFSCPRPECSLGGRLSTQVGRSRRVRFSSLRPDKTSPQQSEGSKQPKDDFGSALVAGEGVVRRPEKPRQSPSVASSHQTGPPVAATLSEVSRKPSIPSSSRLEVIQYLMKRQGYSPKTAGRMSLYLRKSSTAVYQAKWTMFVKWCASKKIEPLEASVPVIADFLVHLRDKMGMSVPAVKGARATLGQVFLLKGIDLGSSRHISMLIRSFEQSCPPSSPRVPKWDLARVLDMLSKPPFKPLKDIVDRNLTLKAAFLLALASAKRVGELHGLS
ncbi:uncharacterized protein [Palaemon carinicauda]|uniref:uncharacterized protein n=1 Tax=Palaemon carinicauda TaxID=392227 RepID=UPI0035B6374B